LLTRSFASFRSLTPSGFSSEEAPWGNNWFLAYKSAGLL
jgi:hypothetical protein